MDIKRKFQIAFIAIISFNSCIENSHIKQKTVFDLCEAQARAKVLRNIANLNNDKGYKGLRLGMYVDSLDLSNFIMSKVTDSLIKYDYYFGPPIKVGDNLTKNIALTFYNRKLSAIEFRVLEDSYNTEDLYNLKYGAAQITIENFIDEGKKYHKDKFLISDAGENHQETIHLIWSTDKIKLSIKKKVHYIIKKYIYKLMERKINSPSDSVWISKRKDDLQLPSIVIKYSLIENDEKIEKDELKIFNKNMQIEKNRQNQENLERVNKI
jgi:hypothetical protein